MGNRLLRMCLFVLGGLVFSAALCLALLPTIASTKWGQEKIRQFVNVRISGEVSFHQLSFSWLGDQKIEKFTLSDSQGQEVVTFASLTIKTPIYRILKEDFLGENLFLTSFHATLSRVENDLGKQIAETLSKLLTGRKEVLWLFGDALEIDFDTHLQKMNGPLSLNITGIQGSLRLISSLSNRMLTLVEPFTMTFPANSQTQKEILRQFSPLFNELVGGESPITYTIFPDNFSIPFFPFDFLQMEIGNAVLDMGKLLFSRTGEVKKIVDLLGPVRSSEISVWTTPQYMHMKNGVLELRRMDIQLLDRYPLATWGTIDFKKDDLNLIVALGGELIEKILDIKGLKKETIIQIPIRGPTENAEIDILGTIAKIGALVIKQKAIAKSSLMSTIFGFIDEKKAKLPPSMTTPLPWEKPDQENQ